MESEAVLNALNFCLKVNKVISGSPYYFDLVSRKIYHKNMTALEKFRIYLGTLFVLLYILMSCFNLSAPIFFGIHLLNDLTSVLANIVTAVITIMVCIPSIQLCLNPKDICGAINYLAPITTAITGTVFLTSLPSICINTPD